MIVSQVNGGEVSENRNKTLNTHQTGRQLIWGPTGYSLLSADLVTGICLLESPRMRTPRHHHQYTVYLYSVPPGKGRCSCPGFASWGRCKHSGVDGIAWQLCWSQGDYQGSVSPSAVSRSYSDFMSTEPGSEAEADFRQECEWKGGWAA